MDIAHATTAELQAALRQAAEDVGGAQPLSAIKQIEAIAAELRGRFAVA